MSAISHKKRKKTRKEIRQIKENPAEGFVVYWRALIALGVTMAPKAKP